MFPYFPTYSGTTEPNFGLVNNSGHIIYRVVVFDEVYSKLDFAMLLISAIEHGRNSALFYLSHDRLSLILNSAKTLSLETTLPAVTSASDLQIL